ncbi:MAG: hydroxymethylpyrimidine kinase/phosphomethylpyrimidine kinase [Hyphomicrobiaceae bacterium]
MTPGETVTTRLLPLVVAAGGLDPSAGAGILADVRTLEACGVQPCAVATAITVQSGRGLVSSKPVAASLVGQQIDEIVAKLGCRWIKVGQVPTERCAQVLAASIRRHDLNLVLDPVVKASGGGALASTAAVRATVRQLLPLARVLTVNLAEAATLAGCRVSDRSGMEKAARRLLALGAVSVVVKGGHLRGQPVDLLVVADQPLRWLASRRIGGHGAGMHGTGCAYASALAANLATGAELETAARAASKHVRELLKTARDFGGGRVLRVPSL